MFSWLFGVLSKDTHLEQLKPYRYDNEQNDGGDDLGFTLCG